VDFNLKIPSIAFNFTEVWIRILWFSVDNLK
jgi:hypothetical protein